MPFFCVYVCRNCVPSRMRGVLRCMHTQQTHDVCVYFVVCRRNSGLLRPYVRHRRLRSSSLRLVVIGVSVWDLPSLVVCTEQGFDKTLVALEERENETPFTKGKKPQRSRIGRPVHICFLGVFFVFLGECYTGIGGFAASCIGRRKKALATSSAPLGAA